MKKLCETKRADTLPYVQGEQLIADYRFTDAIVSFNQHFSISIRLLQTTIGLIVSHYIAHQAVGCKLLKCGSSSSGNKGFLLFYHTLDIVGYCICE